MAEAGDAVDFYELRAAYLASPAFSSGDSHQLRALHDEMFIVRFGPSSQPSPNPFAGDNVGLTAGVQVESWW